MLLIRRFSLLCVVWFLSPTTATNLEVPNEQDRKRTGDIVVQNMNLDGNPCEDFFEFACGNWIQNRSTATIYGMEDHMITPKTDIELAVLKDLEATLSNAQSNNNKDAHRRAYTFYKDCCGTTLHLPAQWNTMNSLKTRYFKRDSSEWLNILAELRLRYGFNFVIAFEIDTNMETGSGNSIYIGEPQNTIIPKEYCNAAAIESMSIHDPFFEKLRNEVSKDMKQWNRMSEYEAQQFANKVLDFEFELCKIKGIDEPMSDEDTQQEMATPQFANGQRRLSGKGRAHDFAQIGFDLGRYVDMIVQHRFNGFTFLRNKMYLRNLSRIIERTKISSLPSYLMYRVFSEFNLPIEPSFQQDHCANLVKKFFPKIATEIRSPNNNDRSELEFYFNNIKKALDQSLSADWISENIKRTARQKLSKLKAQFPVYQNLGFGDYNYTNMDFYRKLEHVMELSAMNDLARLRNDHPDEYLHAVGAYDVNAKLIPFESVILIGPAFLREPFYRRFYPHAMKFALLGHRLARELVFAFDKEGWNPTALSQYRLDEITEEGLRNQTDCFREQYSNYLYNDPNKFQNSNKLREVIADSSGINLAFNAYLNWLGSMHTSSAALRGETLPGVDFTNTQLFFIHFAQTRCAVRIGISNASMDFIPLKTHTTERYDVNGPLSNSVEFAREFGCPIGAEMHPADKCVLY